PSYGRPAVSLSLMRRDRQTPNGLTEFLVARGLELLRDRGVEEASLNFAAFARFIHSPRGWAERIAGRALLVAEAFFQIERLHRRRHERRCLEEVEARPGNLPVVGHVLGRQRRAQVGSPRKQRDRQPPEDEQEPETRPPKTVENPGGMRWHLVGLHRAIVQQR